MPTLTARAHVEYARTCDSVIRMGFSASALFAAGHNVGTPAQRLVGGCLNSCVHWRCALRAGDHPCAASPSCCRCVHDHVQVRCCRVVNVAALICVVGVHLLIPWSCLRFGSIEKYYAFCDLSVREKAWCSRVRGAKAM